MKIGARLSFANNSMYAEEENKLVLFLALKSMKVCQMKKTVNRTKVLLAAAVAVGAGIIIILLCIYLSQKDRVTTQSAGSPMLTAFEAFFKEDGLNPGNPAGATYYLAHPSFSIAPPCCNTEKYKSITENGFVQTRLKPLSTFGADVDTATYTNMRRFLQQQNVLPPCDAIRTEEFINYFSYDYKHPQKDELFNVDFESMPSPWAKERQLLLVGIQAKDIDKSQLPQSNFVFLIDNSGSMSEEIPLLKEALMHLADQLRPDDRISIVTYGGSINTVLDGGCGADKDKIKAEIATLYANGWTEGGAGITEAYRLAHRHFIKNGNNRIVMVTDGDFNVGVSSEEELVSLVEKERSSGVYLSVFGMGSYNYKDNKLKMLANKGNGNYSYIDNVREARRIMTNEMTGKMFVIAKDVKLQIEFNPAKVAAYRLIGYELRKLAASDFNDDSKDSGDVGVGHQVTALYELIMTNAPESVKKQYLGNVDKLKYQQPEKKSVYSNDILTLKLRSQPPEGKKASTLNTFVLKKLPSRRNNIRWASVVTEFAMLLQNSEYKGNADLQTLRSRAQKYLGKDQDGKRTEFLTLVKIAEDIEKVSGGILKDRVLL